MREDYYSDYYEFENNNWWFVSRRTILRALLQSELPPHVAGRIVLDAGCGTGINLQWLRSFGAVVGVDASPEAIRFCALRGETEVRLARIENLPFENDRFDLVSALDVLEHIEDDDSAVSELARVCKPGGWALITVPAHPLLWGEHDEINHHVRRYEPKRIIGLLERSGFVIVRQSFMNTWLFPIAFIWRWWRRVRRWFVREQTCEARADNMHYYPFINRILTAVFSSEKFIVLKWGLPVGLSLVLLCRKRVV